MPRPERPVDPEGGAVARFAIGLRELRRDTGSPGYRELARRVHYSPTTLSQAAGGEVLPSLAVTLAYVRGCGGDVDEWERRWRAAAAELAPEPSPDASRAPYVGLAAYGPEDAEWFHGRDEVVDDLVARVGAHRFVTVLGPSGSGKSSVLRAGLLPRLAADGSKSVAVFTPGAHPFEECAVHLTGFLDRTAGMVAAELAADERGLHRLVRQALVDRPADAEVVLVVDQFEEVFTLCRDTGERSRFVAALVAAARSADSRCRIVLSVRADFYSQCLVDADLVTVLNDGQVAVGPMTVDELRQVVVRPARRAGCMVEGALLAALVAHAHGRVGALPLLSHALLETWRRRSGNTLTLAGFERAGGIDGALDKTAEAVFASLTEDQRLAARQLFLRLVALGEGTPDTRRRVDRQELGADCAAILAAFGDARLVVLSEHGVEITHEALIGAWPRLCSWLADDREGQRIHRKLTDATATWQEHDRDPGALLRGTRLAVVTDWAHRCRDTANQAETAFLDASLQAEERERATDRRRTRVLRQLVVLLAVLVVVATTTAIEAVRAQRAAAWQSDVAIALNAIREADGLVGTNPALAAQISLAAHQLYPSQATASSLVAHVAAATALPLPMVAADIALAPDGHRGAATMPTADSTTVFDIDDDGITPTHTLTGGSFRPQFGSDGKSLLTIDNKAEPHLWDLAGNRPMDSRLPDGTKSMGGTFSPDGTLLVTTDAERRRTPTTQGDTEIWTEVPTTRFWNIADPHHPTLSRSFLNTTARPTAFANQTPVVATTTRDGPNTPPRVTVWDLNSRTADPTPIVGPSRTEPTSATFAPDDRTLYVGDFTGDITVWNVDTPGSPNNVGTVDGNGYPVSELVSSPDGRTLAAIDTAGQLTVWNISSRRTLSVSMSIHAISRETSVSGLTFVANGRTLVAVESTQASGYSSLVQWQLDPTHSGQELCKGNPVDITQTEWDRYLTGALYRPPCDGVTDR